LILEPPVIDELAAERRSLVRISTRIVQCGLCQTHRDGRDAEPATYVDAARQARRWLVIARALTR
jgi:hypothetical protein